MYSHSRLHSEYLIHNEISSLDIESTITWKLY